MGFCFGIISKAGVLLVNRLTTGVFLLRMLLLGVSEGGLKEKAGVLFFMIS